MQKHQIWTPEEVDVLLKVWKDYDQRQISERFIPTKTPIQVNAKKQTMGLNKPPVWSDRERKFCSVTERTTHPHNSKMFFNDKTNNQIAWMRKHLGILEAKNERKLVSVTKPEVEGIDKAEDIIAYCARFLILATK